jgi:hypothetical protein
MERQLWVKRIGDRVKVGEANIDAAIRSVMELVTEVQAAQSDMTVSAIVTDPALAKLVDSLASLQAARTAVVSGHRRLDKIAGDLSLRTTGLGFDQKPPTGHHEVEGDIELERALG